MTRWRPSPFMQLSFGLHAAAGAGLLLAPSAWPLAVGALLADHAVLTLAGLLPRSRLLGPNLTRLPPAAVQLLSGAAFQTPPMTVGELRLMASTLGRGGATHELLRAFPLGG